MQPTPALTAKQGSLRICTYNIFDGLKGQEPERVELLREWLASKALDVVAFNECCGFTAETFASLATRCGFEHSLFLPARTGYHLGIWSRHLLEDPSEVQRPTTVMHHGLLHARLQANAGARFNLLVTHLCPFEATRRMEEVHAIVKFAHNGLRGESTILLGDLNTLSPHDRAAHDHDKLLPLLASSAKLSRKFLCSDISGGGSKEIDYRPMEAVEAGGFHDVPASAGLNGETCHHKVTVPTPANEDENHAAPMRLDYCMLNTAASERFPEACQCCEIDAFTERISDHFPVVLSLGPDSRNSL
eukprot:gnl/TRDRNA2_/TRDRNA2_156084_c0_seq1.p1 gnl/TRDRNA2_/TRDRNA2_156084_c0~~gnl/TRDRNA2_/TRDRNA2_156084_c0_seq1.p1  ORF type:complete len:303 (+),score=55.26 gnl/TRDRNA2_/TRDRNA2_156084_c0_seq1:77-985(+)